MTKPPTPQSDKSTVSFNDFCVAFESATMRDKEKLFDDLLRTSVKSMGGGTSADQPPSDTELDKILEFFRMYEKEDLKHKLLLWNAQSNQRLLSRVRNDVIGEDELHSPTLRTLHNHGIDARNALRDELRQAISRYCGQGKE